MRCNFILQKRRNEITLISNYQDYEGILDIYWLKFSIWSIIESIIKINESSKIAMQIRSISVISRQSLITNIVNKIMLVSNENVKESNKKLCINLT